MITAIFRIRGTAPLMMHNVQLSNPRNKHAKQLAELNRAKKVKGADKEEIGDDVARVEWEGGLYIDDNDGPYIPANNFHKALIEAARMTKEGKSVEQGVQMPQTYFPLIYDGPRDVDGLWAADCFCDIRMVRVGQSKVPRARPVFSKWEAEIIVSYDKDMCDPDRLRAFITTAGTYKGICEARNGTMGMGRFEVQNDDGTWPTEDKKKKG